MNKIIFFILLACSIHSGIKATDQFLIEIEPKGPITTQLQPFDLFLKINHPDNFHVDVEQLKLDLLDHPPWLPTPPFTIISVDESDSEKPHQMIHFRLLPKTLGTFPVRFEKIILKNDVTGEIQELASEIVDIEIKLGKELSIPKPTVLPLINQLPMELTVENQTKLIDMEQHAFEHNEAVLSEVSIPWHFFFFLLILLAGIGIIIMMLLTPSRKQLSHKEIKQNAFEDLRKTCTEDLPIPEFYTQLSHKLRHYLKVEYRIRATVDTSEELLDELKTVPAINAEMQEKLRRLFVSIDDVLFGGHQPSKEEVKEIQTIGLSLKKPSTS